jgi:hypothetical protein
MTFLIALAVLFLALLAGTAIECPRLCSEAWGRIGVSQASLALSPPCCCRGLSPSSVLPSEYSCVSEIVTKSKSPAAAAHAHNGFNAICQPARNPA